MSCGPNVFGRSGQWTIELVGRETLRFGTRDPRQISIYGDTEDAPHNTQLANDISWELVLPLHDESGQSLEVSQINIYDENSERLFTADIDYESWRRASQR